MNWNTCLEKEGNWSKKKMTVFFIVVSIYLFFSLQISCPSLVNDIFLFKYVFKFQNMFGISLLWLWSLSHVSLGLSPDLGMDHPPPGGGGTVGIVFQAYILPIHSSVVRISLFISRLNPFHWETCSLTIFMHILAQAKSRRFVILEIFALFQNVYSLYTFLSSIIRDFSKIISHVYF